MLENPPQARSPDPSRKFPSRLAATYRVKAPARGSRPEEPSGRIRPLSSRDASGLPSREPRARHGAKVRHAWGPGALVHAQARHQRLPGSPSAPPRAAQRKARLEAKRGSMTPLARAVHAARREPCHSSASIWCTRCPLATRHVAAPVPRSEVLASHPASLPEPCLAAPESPRCSEATEVLASHPVSLPEPYLAASEPPRCSGVTHEPHPGARAP